MVQNKHGRDKVSFLGIVDIVATDYSNYYLFSSLVAYADTSALISKIDRPQDGWRWLDRMACMRVR